MQLLIVGGRFGVDEGFTGASHGGRMVERRCAVNKKWVSLSS